jgi:hypothetical protein
MTVGKTARDLAPRELLPRIAKYLREHGATAIFNTCGRSGSLVASLETWVLGQLAAILRTIYILPQTLRPGFQIPKNCRLSKRDVILIQDLCRLYVHWFYDQGWIVKDASGVTFMSRDFKRVLDAIANAD